MPRRDRVDSFEVRHLTEQANRQDRSGAFGHRGFKLIDVHVEAGSIDVDEHRRGTDKPNDRTVGPQSASPVKRLRPLVR